MKTRKLLVALMTALSAQPLFAQVTPISKFAGDMFEGFENVAEPGAYSPLPIFEGTATMTDSLANIGVVTFIWSGPGGEVQAYNGNLFGGTPAGSNLITFSQPIANFGGFITTVSDIADGTVIFRDENAATIATLTYIAAPTVWGWQGWHSDTPIKSIEFISNGPFGNRPIQLDDLRISFPANCPADLDGSGAVDLPDLTILLAQFGSTGGTFTADLDGDGEVNLTDLAIMLGSFGTACP